MLVHSSGRVVTNIDNLSEFCREESLIYENMYELLNNIANRRSVKGWYLLEDFEEPKNVCTFTDVNEKKLLKLRT